MVLLNNLHGIVKNISADVGPLFVPDVANGYLYIYAMGLYVYQPSFLNT